ncbi:acyltransferase domain-containing protein, partial [Streptomyces amakusaensis]|uniref:acyltransferase domain-containing protein n=1 Tax=Streptomyces amakusaensis TaxID=67271 RepID=UPI0031CFB308
TEEAVLPLLAGREATVGIAAINGPDSLVIAGTETDTLDIAQSLGVKFKRLPVSHAFHSPLMEPMLNDFRDVVSGLTFQAPRIPIVSTVTGRLTAPDELCTADYWVEHVRRPVRFTDAIHTLTEQGIDNLLELGPDATLSALTNGTPAMRKNRPEAQQLITALAHLHVNGTTIDWTTYYQNTRTHPIQLPTYAFQHERYWLEPVSSGTGDVSSAGLVSAEHPLLGAAIELADGEGLVLTGRLSLKTHPWLADHTIFGTVLLPGTAFVELATQAGDRTGYDTIEELTLAAPLTLPEHGNVHIQITVTGREFAIYSRPDGDDHPWTQHATGTLTNTNTPNPTKPTTWPPTNTHPINLTHTYETLHQHGYTYGPAFQGL